MGQVFGITEDTAQECAAPEDMSVDTTPFNLPRTTERIWWAVSVCLGLLSLWFVKYVIYSDGISYLEIASKYRSGNWHEAINAYWSPLYSWLLAVAGWILRPPAAWEVSMLHLVNFLAFAGSLFTFRFFLRQLVRVVVDRGGLQSSHESRAWLSVAYSLFLWAGLILTPLGLVTPDAITNLLLYAIAGLVIRIRRENGGPRMFAALGLLLGLCYLTRAAFLIGPAVFLAALLGSVRPLRCAARNSLIAACVFGAVIAPWVLAISHKTGHLTFGESGRLNYAWEVRGMRRSTHWQGEPGVEGTPLHPTRKLMDQPAVFEFGEPLQATYAPWYDPSWWHTGIHPQFQLADQLRTAALNLRLAAATLFPAPGFLWVLWNISAGKQRKSLMESLVRLWWCWAPPLCLIGGYSLVFMDTRYVASAIVIVVLTAIAAGFSRSLSSVTARAASWLAILTCTGFFAVPVLIQLYSVGNSLSHSREMYPNTEYQASSEFASLGLRKGTKVAYIGNAMNADWARLLGTPIVAEVPVRFDRDDGVRREVVVNQSELEAYWRATAETKNKVLELFRQAGAEVVVADLVPDWADTTGWIRLKTRIYKKEGNSWTYLRFPGSTTKP